MRGIVFHVERQDLYVRNHERVTLIGVIGASHTTAPVYAAARSLGAEIGRRSWWVVCGGLGGVMEGACRGAREVGSHAIGILPGADRHSANSWVDVSIVSGIGEARNTIIARTAHAVVALPGGLGTLSEIAFCIKFGTPVVALLPRGCESRGYPELEVVTGAAEACEWVSRHI
jgi:uncharacterized protein (TIGR00725 family)